ncbi:MAG: hypothetical protein R6V19_07300, partial [Armatimonadota bacterium]
MKPAICTSFNYEIPFSEVIPMVRDAGFEAVCIGAKVEHSEYDTRAGRSAIRKLLEHNDLTLDSVHAPLPEGDQLFAIEETERAESVRQCQIALD